MRTSLNQKIENFIKASDSKFIESFDSVVRVSELNYNNSKSLSIEFSYYVNKDKSITTCAKKVIKYADLMKHHKGTLPWDHFIKD